MSCRFPMVPIFRINVTKQSITSKTNHTQTKAVTVTKGCLLKTFCFFGFIRQPFVKAKKSIKLVNESCCYRLLMLSCIAQKRGFDFSFFLFFDFFFFLQKVLVQGFSFRNAVNGMRVAEGNIQLSEYPKALVLNKVGIKPTFRFKRNLVV